MAIQKDSKDYSVAYVEDLLSAEKNLFLLKLIRDDIQKQYDESRQIASREPQEYKAEEPKPVECKLKRIPEKPVLNDAKNKIVFFSNILLKSAIASCILLFVDFVIVLIATGFLTKPLSGSGIFSSLMILLMILTAIFTVGSVILRIIERIQYKEDMRSWLAVKEQIEQYNLDEIKKSEELTKLQAQQYYKDAETENARRISDTFCANAKADVFELQKAKINAGILTTEKLLMQMYSYDASIPHNIRRIDSVFTIESYIQNGTAQSIESAVELYNNSVREGAVAERFSDIIEDRAKYTELIPELMEYMVSAESEAQKITLQATDMASLIAEKAVNKNTGAVNTGVIAAEFRRLYDESQIYVLLDGISLLNKAFAEKYS